jgi:hypothetical protein
MGRGCQASLGDTHRASRGDGHISSKPEENAVQHMRAQKKGSTLADGLIAESDLDLGSARPGWSLRTSATG